MPTKNVIEEPAYETLNERTTDSFTQVSYTNPYGEGFDTSTLFTQKYDPATRIRETSLILFADDWEKDLKSPLYAGIGSRMSDGNRIISRYNADGMPLSIKVYLLLPASSASALYSHIMMKRKPGEGEMDKSRGDNDGEPEYKAAARQAGYLRYAGLLKRSGIPEVVTSRSEELFTYDEDGNPLTKTGHEDKEISRYSYVHDADGRVQIQREAYVNTVRGGQPDRTFQERHFTYTPAGEVATWRSYVFEHDSMNVATEANLRILRENYYNSRGLPDSFIYTAGKTQTVHVITYTDTQRAAYTAFFRYPSPAGMISDTVSRVFYEYKSGLLSHLKTFYQDAGSHRMAYNREEYLYNGRRQLVETRKYGSYRHGADTSKPVEIDLFFYRGRGNRETTARSRALMAWRHRRPGPRPEKPVGVDEPPPVTSPDIMPPAQIDLPLQQRLIFTYVEQVPQFRGDVNVYLKKALAAVAVDTECRVLIKFVIEDSGAVTDATVMRSSGIKKYDDAALAAVRAMPPWIPGKQNGRAVPVYYTIPVRFRRK